MKEVYQMPSRNARGNTFKEGITEGEHYGVNQFDTGVTMEALKGVPKPNEGSQPGVPMPGEGHARKVEPQTPHCTAITKAGEPCKAAPIKGEWMCVGHSRQAGDLE